MQVVVAIHPLHVWLKSGTETRGQIPSELLSFIWHVLYSVATQGEECKLLPIHLLSLWLKSTKRRRQILMKPVSEWVPRSLLPVWLWGCQDLKGLPRSSGRPSSLEDSGIKGARFGSIEPSRKLLDKSEKEVFPLRPAVARDIILTAF